MRGEDLECMWDRLRKVHSFIRARWKNLFADIGIDAAFEYVKELIFAIMHVGRRFIPVFDKAVRHTEGPVRLFAVDQKGHHVSHIPAGVLKVPSLHKRRQSGQVAFAHLISVFKIIDCVSSYE
jgi:hypothetical protein